jgi:8-oxo-dGTP pyrophosphatase MutT (NUDIX family)
MSTGIPAATVVLVRNGGGGLETLLLRRNSKIAFGGMWVFPGGRIDESDWHGLAPTDELAAARRAAVRETHEEAGLTIAEETLVALSHWTPPALAPKRFLTWFFLAPATSDTVTIDRGEIHEHVWLRPAKALARRNALEIELAPPTWVTLEWLGAHPDVDASLAAAAARAPERFVTRIAASLEGPVALWHGDAAYAAEEIDREGPRHRLYMRASGWVYDRN